MRIVFFASDHFALPCLEMLYNSEDYKLIAVITQPDRRAGRGLKLKATPVKEWAEAKKLTIYQPDDVNASEFLDSLKEISADIYILASFGQILGAEILSMPLIALNIHPSLLPRYRGPAPINWALINGDEITGVTIIKMEPEVDAGKIIIQKEFPIYPDDNSLTLEKRLAEEGALLLKEALFLIANGQYQLKEQEGKPTYAPRLTKKDGLINWQKTALTIHNMVRGLQPWPSAYTYWNKKILKIWQTDFINETLAKPGEIVKVSKDNITVSCGKGSLLIKELQLEGTRRMKVQEFLAGHQIEKGQCLGRGD